MKKFKEFKSYLVSLLNFSLIPFFSLHTSDVSLIRFLSPHAKDVTFNTGGPSSRREYSQSSPCDHSRKRPALVTTSIVNPRLTCHLNSVMKSSRKRPFGKRPRPLLWITNGLFPLFLRLHKTSYEGYDKNLKTPKNDEIAQKDNRNQERWVHFLYFIEKKVKFYFVERFYSPLF